MISGRRIVAATAVACLSIGAGVFVVGQALGDASQPCNAYYPLPSGGTWTYREGPLGGKPRVEKTVVVRSVEGSADRRVAQIEQSVRTPGAPGVAAGRARTTVHCDGGRIGMTVRGVAQGREGKSTASGSVDARLPGLPPAAKLVPGYEWTSESRIEAKDAGVSATTTGTRKNRVAGFETVTVPAGRFDGALKVETVEELRQEGQGRSARQELIEWYVRGVGLVMRETRVRSGTQSATSVEALTASSLVR